jgi:cell division protein FtsB
MYLAGTAIHGEARYLEMRSQVQKLQEQSYRLQALDRTLRSQVRQLLSPAFAAQLARTQMGYVSPGEIPLVVTPLPAGHRRSPQG